MSHKADYSVKFASISEQTLLNTLSDESRMFIREMAHEYRFTQQDLRQVTEIARDLQMWGESNIESVWPVASETHTGKQEKQRILRTLVATWERYKEAANNYQLGTSIPVKKVTAEVMEKEKGKLGLGYCPVASPKTRCCNLLTLDAVDNCGYGCSYCSIQSFFTGDQVYFDPEFADKLAALSIDPEKTYHIGTGQSSDSLMWGNSHGVLQAQIEFARKHPNVILEFKTKSANVSYLLNHDLPPNIICSWSLNTPTIISNEEHASAPLEKRLDAAKHLAEKGVIVGFHFHPMIHYQGWKEEYADLFNILQTSFFDPKQVAMVSLGTLTFIKPVIKKIREQGSRSQILKMPMVDTEGKLSYPGEIKLELFSHAYNSFSSQWQKEVFFYLCMENHNIWKPVFGIEYESNEAFEQAMKQSYSGKIERLRNQIP
ncbi:SPL family radical SAM protein [Solemya velesiana gill symbiont]|uniref:DNA photolyase n=1 Tax=Solemya velesiana gill symbiont TaxID=1918948 RepID=A0A1T2KY37_9GAMM|nr:DNA photolyase [Solemya velesiana gill symbiont]OOZ37743.1 DNA photolyase [Solemya velesiana gill symbiont]